MDLWDLTKLMVRRWYISVLVMVATFGALIWIIQTTGPDYVATGHVAVLPSEVHRVAAAGETVRSSPWNEEALAHASQIRLQGKQLRETMAEAGYQGDWVVSVSGRLPVITIKVVASSPEQALDTLHHLQDVVADEVRHRQDQYAVPEEERSQAVRYDTGESIETSTGSLRRALVAAAGAGAILTVAVTVIFDALARRRGRGGSTRTTLGPLPMPTASSSPETPSASGPTRELAPQAVDSHPVAVGDHAPVNASTGNGHGGPETTDAHRQTSMEARGR